MEIYEEFTFDAAHRVPGVAEGHAYHGLHGHSFVARVVLLGKVDPRTGFIADLGEIEKSCERLRERLAQKDLIESAGLEVPSVENLPVGIWKNFDLGLDALALVAGRCDPG